MDQATLDYIQTRIASVEYTTTGDITTTCKIMLDNGMIVENSSIRDISMFNKEEAEKAAHEKAVGTFYPGVNLILTKK